MGIGPSRLPKGWRARAPIAKAVARLTASVKTTNDCPLRTGETGLTTGTSGGERVRSTEGLSASPRSRSRPNVAERETVVSAISATACILRSERKDKTKRNSRLGSATRGNFITESSNVLHAFFTETKHEAHGRIFT